MYMTHILNKKCNQLQSLIMLANTLYPLLGEVTAYYNMSRPSF